MRRKERIDWLSFRFDIKGIPEAEIKGVLVALEEKRKYYRLANGSLLSLESKEFNEINQFVKESGIRKEFLHGEEVNVPLIRSVKWMNGLHEGNVLSLDESVQDLVESIQTRKIKVYSAANFTCCNERVSSIRIRVDENTRLLPFWRYFSRRHGTWKNVAKYCL